MAKRKTTRAVRTRRKTASRKVKELESTAAFSSEGLIELDINAIESEESAMSVTASSAEGEPSEEGFEVTADLMAARDALLEHLGGTTAMAAVKASGVLSSAPFGVENIRGVGVGAKESQGAFTGDIAVKVLVREKLASRRLSLDAEIPEDIDGIPTDVEQVDDFHVASYARRFPRPVPGGASCGHIEVTAGTIGCLVELNNGRLALLSNNHVLANGNDATEGDRIIQPGPDDGGNNTNADLVGTLERFIRLNYGGDNLVDAAAAFTSFQLVSADHVTYAVNPNPAQAAPFVFVKKNGRTTQATAGWVSAVNVNGVPVGYQRGTAFFNDVTVVRSLNLRPFSLPGDSGSLIVTTNTNRPLGLLFAGNASHTLANPIGTVMAQLGIRRFVGPS